MEGEVARLRLAYALPVPVPSSRPERPCASYRVVVVDLGRGIDGESADEEGVNDYVDGEEDGRATEERKRWGGCDTLEKVEEGHYGCRGVEVGC